MNIVRNFKTKKQNDFIGILYSFYSKGFYSNTSYLLLNCVFIHDNFGNKLPVQHTLK